MLILSHMTVSTTFTELLIFLQPNLKGWYIIISCSVMDKNWIVVFEVKVRVNFQNFIESLSSMFCTNDLLAIKVGMFMYYS